MYNVVDEMKGIPLRTELGNATYLGDVGTPKDTSFIQTNIVRVNGRRQVYIPVFRQLGSSTLSVVDNLKAEAPKMEPKLTRPDINLKVVMDQSVYVRQSIKALVQEGLSGAVLCSLVILIFFGRAADDGNRHLHHSSLRPGRDHRAVCHGLHDQRDDSRGPGARDRSAGR
jgi:multidrug efflux pump subunit AcrB